MLYHALKDFNRVVYRFYQLRYTLINNTVKSARNWAVILLDTIVSISEVEFTTNGPPNLHTFKKQHGRKADYLYEKDLEVFAYMIENGNFDEEEFTSEYCKMINTVRFLSTS